MLVKNSVKNTATMTTTMTLTTMMIFDRRSFLTGGQKMNVVHMMTVGQKHGKDDDHDGDDNDDEYDVDF